MRRLWPCALLAALAGCDLSLGGFTYFSCAGDADCPPGQTCGANNLCQAPGSGSSSGSSSTGGASGSGISSSSSGASSSSGSSASSSSSSSSGTTQSSSSSGSPPPAGLAPGISVGVVTGQSSGAGYVNGSLLNAEFDMPISIAFSSGSLYVGDTVNEAIRVIDLGAGEVTTLDDGGIACNDLIVANNTLYIGAGEDIDTVLLPSGPVVQVASGTAPYADLGVQGFAFDGMQTLYLSDESDNCILAFDLSNASLSQFAGQCGTSGGYSDGTAASARFNGPRGLALDPAGNLYVADWQNRVIRKVSAGSVTTFAGNAKGAENYADGPPLDALFVGPLAMAADSQGDLFVSDDPNRVREIKPLADGGYYVYTLANMVAADGNNYEFEIGGIALDEDGGNLYFTDTTDSQIWVLRGF